MPPEADVRRWLDQVVIHLGLCPFARNALPGLRIVVAGPSPLEDILAAAASLDAATEPATTLVVAPTLTDFDAYLAALAEAEGVLSAAGYDGIVQLASFHPDYCFEGIPPDDPANFTNRSPWPMFHLLREADVSAAVDRHPDPHGIPARNEALLRGLTREQLSAVRQLAVGIVD